MRVCIHAPEFQRILFSAKDYISGDHFTLQQCETCGLVSTTPVPPPGHQDRYYPEAYYGDPALQRFPGLVERLQHLLYRYRARRVGMLVTGPTRRVLDIGCGKGFLLDAFRCQGWTVQGVELSEFSARHGREILGLKIHVGELSDSPLAGLQFDVAVLWHVLEHTKDPCQVLEDTQAKLTPNGLLLVSVPNFNSLESRLSGPAWFHLDVPRHLVHYSRNVLLNQLKASGLEVVDEFRFAPEFDLFSFVQSALNRIGLPLNHLYRLLRGNGAKLPGSAGNQWWASVASLGLAVPLTLVGLPWVALAGCLSNGSTLTLVARKQPPSA